MPVREMRCKLMYIERDEQRNDKESSLLETLTSTIAGLQTEPLFRHHHKRQNNVCFRQPFVIAVQDP